MQKIIILISVLSLFSFDCSNNSNEIQLQNENVVLKNQLDSLQNNYNILNQQYVELKNKPPDSIKILIPVDSINWIDSTRYVLKDSVVLIPHDTTIVNYKDSLVIIPHDTLITHIKDSLIYNFKDTLIYNFRDSLIISYDERTFPEENIEKYLNLFFKTDNVNDTAGLKFNFSIFAGRRNTFLFDKNYLVPDSIIGWKLEWYQSQIKNYKNKNEIKVEKVWWKETGLAEPALVSQLNDNNLSTSYNFNKGYLIADLTKTFEVDSIQLFLSNKEQIGWWLSADDVSIGNENYLLDGESTGNGFVCSYIPKNKNIRYINISTKYGIQWQISELKVYGKLVEGN